MPQNSDYFFFKETIAPKWEDPKNAPGGQISVSTSQGRLDPEAFWLYSVKLKKRSFDLWLISCWLVLVVCLSITSMSME